MSRVAMTPRAKSSMWARHREVGEQPARLPAALAGEFEEPEHEQRPEGQQPGHDLVPGQAGEEEAEGEQRRAQQRESEVAREDGREVRVGVPKQHPEVEEGHGEHPGVERERGEELPEHDLSVGDRRGQQQLDGSRADLLGHRPHREQGHQEQHQDRGARQQPADQVVVDMEVSAAEPTRWPIRIPASTKLWR